VAALGRPDPEQPGARRAQRGPARRGAGAPRLCGAARVVVDLPVPRAAEELGGVSVVLELDAPADAAPQGTQSAARARRVCDRLRHRAARGRLASLRRAARAAVGRGGLVSGSAGGAAALLLRRRAGAPGTAMAVDARARR